MKTDKTNATFDRLPTLHPGDTYTCGACGGVFTATATPEEVAAEVEANGFDPNEAGDMVCDDCYQKMAPVFGFVMS